MKRQNEKIDQIAGKLITYLRDEFNDTSIAYDSPLTQLRGGFETATYRFQLKGVQKELRKPLVLRLYPEFYGPENALWESTMQNVLAGEGYPVARVYFICTDKSILGGAFFIMDFLSGKPLLTAPQETIPRLLGETHAALHALDPKPVIKALHEQGIEKNRYRLSQRFDRLKDKASQFHWIGEGVAWLINNRPPESERLAVCHGDFQPLNILIDDGKVTGVLDWPGFLIADPVLDIANTLVLTTIPFKYLASTLGQDLSAAEVEMAAELYLDAYQAQRSIDSTYLDYYRVRRSVHALIQGVEGQQVWQHPLVVGDLIEYIHRITGIRITKPD